MLNFNISLNDEFDLMQLDHILTKQIISIKNNSILFEYVENGVLQNVTLNHIDEYYNFDRSKIQFSILKFEGDLPDEFTAIQYALDNFRVYGKKSDSILYYKILNELALFVRYSFLHNDTDVFLSRTNNYRSWLKKTNLIPEGVKIVENNKSLSERDRLLVDLETFVTHQHLMTYGDKLWFGACAEMSFSKIYYKYIPRILWDSIDFIETRIEQHSGLRKIVLYNEFEDYNNAVNRVKQQQFRAKLGIDSIAHELCNLEPLISDNDFVSISRKDLIKGCTRVLFYLDSNNQKVKRGEASKILIEEYLDDGISLVHSEIIDI